MVEIDHRSLCLIVGWVGGQQQRLHQRRFDQQAERHAHEDARKAQLHMMGGDAMRAAR
ncbi:hypothetical protein QFZ91_000578 [Paraburkholderia sp. JPY419]